MSTGIRSADGPIDVQRLGLIDYQAAWDRQRALADDAAYSLALLVERSVRTWIGPGQLYARAQHWQVLQTGDPATTIVAPRERTRGLVLDGRSFLHEYRWQDDTGFAVLTLILTAPMVVTNWINLQYYASTVDPVRYGSGDKVLHNVVGGNVGVVEGAGGDLRIGLALQSVHDGADWVHEPLRLSVFVEAPAAAIDGIINAHAVVRQLVTNGWLYLSRIDPFDGQIYARRARDWQLVRARS